VEAAVAQRDAVAAATGRQAAEQSTGGHGGFAQGGAGVERASRGWRGLRKALGCLSTSTAGRGEGSGRAAEEEAGTLGHGCHAPATCPPLRQFTEHVSSSKVA